MQRTPNNINWNKRIAKKCAEVQRIAARNEFEQCCFNFSKEHICLIEKHIFTNDAIHSHEWNRIPCTVKRLRCTSSLTTKLLQWDFVYSLWGPNLIILNCDLRSPPTNTSNSYVEIATRGGPLRMTLIADVHHEILSHKHLKCLSDGGIPAVRLLQWWPLPAVIMCNVRSGTLHWVPETQRGLTQLVLPNIIPPVVRYINTHWPNYTAKLRIIIHPSNGIRTKWIRSWGSREGKFVNEI